MSQAASAPARRCAVIYNPTKVSDQFRQLVTNRLERDGWADTLWLETSADDPGRGMTKEAVDAQVDLVIGAGGDGTVRVVADGLAGSGIPMGSGAGRHGQSPCAQPRPAAGGGCCGRGRLRRAYPDDRFDQAHRR